MEGGENGGRRGEVASPQTLKDLLRSPDKHEEQEKKGGTHS